MFRMSQTTAPSSDALSIRQAIAVFDLLSAMDDIPYDYRSRLCFQVAHVLCMRLHKMDLTPYKAWALGDFENGQGLRTALPDGKRCRSYSFHVAATLPVRMENGEIQPLVFDPALYDGPTLVCEWAAVQNARENLTHVLPFEKEVLGPNPGMPGSAEAQKLYEDSLHTLKAYKAAYPDRGPVFKAPPVETLRL